MSDMKKALNVSFFFAHIFINGNRLCISSGLRAPVLLLFNFHHHHHIMVTVPMPCQQRRKDEMSESHCRSFGRMLGRQGTTH